MLNKKQHSDSSNPRGSNLKYLKGIKEKKINSHPKRRLISFAAKDTNTRASIFSNKQLLDQFCLVKGTWLS